MPNWVTNKVKIEKRGKEILDKIIKVDSDKEELSSEDVLFDFEKIIPMPKTLHLTSGGNQDIAIQYAFYKMKSTEREEKFSLLRSKGRDSILYTNYYEKSFRKKYTIEEMEKENIDFVKYLNNNEKKPFDNVDYKDLGIKDLKDLGNMYIDNIIKYDYDTWYDWSVHNWGTKWNSCNTYRISDNEVEFATAWSCPVEVLKKLSEQYKDVEIYVKFADEDIGSNCGEITFLNGEVKEYIDMDGNVDFALEVCGYDKEEYYKEMNEE